MTAREWVETTVGFIVPTAAVVWGVWILWAGLRPDAVKRPSSLVGGVIGFLLTCVLVILIILAWELFRAWRRPRAKDFVAAHSSSVEVGLWRGQEGDGPRPQAPADVARRRAAAHPLEPFWPSTLTSASTESQAFAVVMGWGLETRERRET